MMRRFPSFVALAALVPVLSGAAGPPVTDADFYHHDPGRRACCLTIAHAAGAIDGNSYTNSEEAMLASLGRGIRVFEVDFARTRDGTWVGTHDWAHWQKQTHHEGGAPPAYSEFVGIKLTGYKRGEVAVAYTPITIGFLEKTVALHSDVIIITDTKYELGELARALKGTKLFGRVYPQAYSLHDIDTLAGIGYTKIILTIYKMDLGSPEKVLGDVASVAGRLHAVTVPLNFYAQNRDRLTAIGLPVYVHGSPTSMKSIERQRRFKDLGVSGFYLD